MSKNTDSILVFPNKKHPNNPPLDTFIKKNLKTIDIIFRNEMQKNITDWFFSGETPNDLDDDNRDYVFFFTENFFMYVIILIIK